MRRRLLLLLLYISAPLLCLAQTEQTDTTRVHLKGRVVDEGDFQHILHHAQDPYTRLLVEKRADVMRRYRQGLAGGLAEVV